MDHTRESSPSDIANLKTNNSELAKALAESKTQLADVIAERDHLRCEMINTDQKYRNYIKDIQLSAKSTLDTLIHFSNHITKIISATSILLANHEPPNEIVQSSKCEPQNCTKTQAVKPMIDGHVILRPTISLRRLKGTSEEIRQLTTLMNDDNSQQSNEDDQSEDNDSVGENFEGEASEDYRQTEQLPRISEEHSGMVESSSGEPAHRPLISGIFGDVRVYLSPLQKNSTDRVHINTQRGSQKTKSRSNNVRQNERSSGTSNPAEISTPSLMSSDSSINTSNSKPLMNSLLTSKNFASSTPTGCLPCTSYSFTTNSFAASSSVLKETDVKPQKNASQKLNTRSHKRNLSRSIDELGSQISHGSLQSSNLNLSEINSVTNAYSNVTMNKVETLAQLGLAPSPSSSSILETKLKRPVAFLSDSSEEILNKKRKLEQSSTKALDASSKLSLESKRFTRNSSKKSSLVLKDEKHSLQLQSNGVNTKTRKKINGLQIEGNSKKSSTPIKANKENRRSNRNNSSEKIEAVSSTLSTDVHKITSSVKSEVTESSLKKISLKKKISKISPKGKSTRQNSPMKGRPKRDSAKALSFKEPSLNAKLRR